MKIYRMPLVSGLFSIFLLAACGQQAGNGTGNLSSDSARVIAKEAWIYAYPLFYNYKSQYLYALDKNYPDGAGGFNKFKNYAKTFTPSDTSVVTPNNDTPYSWAILNLSDEPVVLEVPAIPNRYYSFQLVDLYTYNFDYIGSRATGDKAGKYLIAGPDWKGDQPAGINKLIRSETNLVTLLGRTELKMAPGDIANVKKIQETYQLTPLHIYTKQPAPTPKEYALPYPVFNKADLSDARFIVFFNTLLQYCSESPAEKELRERFARIGIGPGKPFDSTAYSKEVLTAINEGVASAAKELEDGTTKLTNATDLFGTRQMMGGDYFKRALGAAAGLFGNTKDEAIYIGTPVDKNNHPLSGKTNYVIRFPKGQTPPAKYFWSITIYELPSRSLVSNPINRYSIGDRTTGLKTTSTGDLDIYIQHAAPKGEENNWLPSPTGPFYYLIRIYGPDASIINGNWKAPQPEPVN